MHERIKEHDKDIRLARAQSLAISEYANKTGHYPLWDNVEFIAWYTRRVAEAFI